MPHTIDSAIIEIERRAIESTSKPSLIGVWSLMPHSGKTYFISAALNSLSSTSGTALMLTADPDHLLLIPSHTSYLFIDCGFSNPRQADLDRRVVDLKLGCTIGRGLDTSVFIYNPDKKPYSSKDLALYDIAIANNEARPKNVMTVESVLDLRDQCKPAPE